MNVRSASKNDQARWNTFVQKNGPVSGRFLQMWDWGRFQEATGKRVVRRWIEDGTAPRGAAQLVNRPLPMGFGCETYCPRGPVLYASSSNIPDLKQVANDCLFFRFEPEDEVQVKQWRAQPSRELQPAHTWLTDLSQAEEDLLSDMHKKTRYNIRLAQRRGVHVQLQETDFDRVWPLFEETGTRGAFGLHERVYYKTMLETLQKGSVQARLAVAYVDDDPAAAAIVIDCGDTRTYLHGASAYVHRKHMAPYLLHWELIREAKAQGKMIYDWWGVAPEGAGDAHPWAGVTRFKLGFPGERLSYPGTFDVPLHPMKYRVYTWLRSLRRGFRRQ